MRRESESIKLARKGLWAEERYFMRPIVGCSSDYAWLLLVGKFVGDEIPHLFEHAD